MTKDQQAALEQVAREWLIENEYGCWRGDELLISPEDVRRLSLLLAAQRAAVLERTREELLRLTIQGGYYGPIWALDEWLKRMIEEQRP